MASKLFRKSSILVKISSYRIPINWLLARIQEPEAETLTFQADLDLHPTFNLELQNRRWFARTQKNLNVEGPGWQFEGCVPVVLTTRLDWQKELTTAIQSVLAVDQRENLQVQFRQSSPTSPQRFRSMRSLPSRRWPSSTCSVQSFRALQPKLPDYFPFASSSTISRVTA